MRECAEVLRRQTFLLRQDLGDLREVHAKLASSVMAALRSVCKKCEVGGWVLERGVGEGEYAQQQHTSTTT